MGGDFAAQLSEVRATAGQGGVRVLIVDQRLQRVFGLQEGMLPILRGEQRLWSVERRRPERISMSGSVPYYGFKERARASWSSRMVNHIAS